MARKINRNKVAGIAAVIVVWAVLAVLMRPYVLTDAKGVGEWAMTALAAASAMAIGVQLLIVASAIVYVCWLVYKTFKEWLYD